MSLRSGQAKACPTTATLSVSMCCYGVMASTSARWRRAQVARVPAMVHAREQWVMRCIAALPRPAPTFLEQERAAWFLEPSAPWDGMLYRPRRQRDRLAGNWPLCMFATESSLDMIAGEMGIDPLELAPAQQASVEGDSDIQAAVSRTAARSRYSRCSSARVAGKRRCRGAQTADGVTCVISVSATNIQLLRERADTSTCAPERRKLGWVS